MRVSVIIPAYRAAHTIGRALDSVLAQSWGAYEIIVVDDGSPDDIAHAVADYGNRVTLLRQPNGGAAARNRGIEHATGDFISFLDADDYWAPRKLEVQLGLFERHPELGLVAGDHFQQAPGGAKTPTSDGQMRLGNRVLMLAGPEAFYFATTVWTGVVIVRRDVLGDERFVSGLEPAEDRDLWVRLTVRAPVYWSSEPLATAVLEPNSLSRGSLERDCTNMLRVVDRNRSRLGPVAASMWRSHTLYRWAAVEQDPSRGFVKLLRSFVHWPIPFRRELCTMRWARPKLLVITLMRMMDLRHDRP